MKNLILIYILLLTLAGCDLLLPEKPNERTNEDDPWLDPYSVESITLTESDAKGMGFAVAIYDSLLAVGAPQSDVDTNTAAGKVFVYQLDENDTWTLIAAIQSENPEANGGFGYSVALSENYLVVGAPDETVAGDATAGAVYVYVKSGTSTWNFFDKLTLDDYTDEQADPGEKFGSKVAIEGAYLFASAREDDPVNNYGAVYVYKYIIDGFEGLVKLDAGLNMNANAQFGGAMQLKGNLLIVGAYSEYQNTIARAGAAYVFERSGDSFSLIRRLEAPEPENFGWFGASVAINETDIFIGAIGQTVDSYSTAGKVYVYSYDNGWPTSPTQTITSENPGNGAMFGISCAINNDAAFVGTPYEGAGIGYVYEKKSGTWELSHANTSDDAAYLGASAAMDDTYLLIGTDDIMSEDDAGGAVIFTSN